MKIVIFALLLFLNSLYIHAQGYDLLVKTNRDSIAYRIDSITSSHYFFEMRSNGAWVHTHIEKSDVVKFEAKAVDRNTANFIRGTSIIEPYSERNGRTPPGKALFLEIGGKAYDSLNFDLKLRYYHRINPFVSVMDYNVVIGNESEGKALFTMGVMYSYLFGKSKSFFELGIGVSSSFRVDYEYAWIS